MRKAGVGLPCDQEIRDYHWLRTLLQTGRGFFKLIGKLYTRTTVTRKTKQVLKQEETA